jgi:hypothetical protein
MTLCSELLMSKRRMRFHLVVFLSLYDEAEALGDYIWIRYVKILFTQIFKIWSTSLLKLT